VSVVVEITVFDLAAVDYPLFAVGKQVSFFYFNLLGFLSQVQQMCVKIEAQYEG